MRAFAGLRPFVPDKRPLIGRSRIRTNVLVAAGHEGDGITLTVLVPAISPLREHRELARGLHDKAGIEFFEVFVDTPLEDCERRDPKGLYAKARRGEITHFTGIDSPYQRPQNPDLRLMTQDPVDELAAQVIGLLGPRG